MKTTKQIRTNDRGTYTQYFCDRCRVWILEEDWNGNKHKYCNKYFESLKIKEKVNDIPLRMD